MKINKIMEIESKMPPYKDAEPEEISNLWNVYTTNDIHEKIFGKKVKELKKYPWKRKIIKITSTKTNLSVYRIWNGTPSYIKSQGMLYIDKNAMYSLINDKNDKKVEIVLSKGNRLKYYWNHYDAATRVSFKLGFLSVVLGFLSLALAIALAFT